MNFLREKFPVRPEPVEGPDCPELAEGHLRSSRSVRAEVSKHPADEVGRSKLHAAKRIAIGAAIAAVHLVAAAQASPVGLWKTIDDDGRTEKSLVRITESGGVLTGRVEKVLDPAADPKGVCDKCTDERRGQPIVGLAILRNLKRGEGDWWQGGDVTDPKNGKTYRAQLRTVDDGGKLQMRGYIGPFYRTQTWIRVE